jgi:hypothetical protein
MAKSLTNQPVTTPAQSVTFSMVRNLVNPMPAQDAPPAVWAEWGYANAMLDAVLSEYNETGDPDEIIGAYDLTDIRTSLHYYEGADWHVLEWDEAGLDSLRDLDWSQDMFKDSL